MNKLSQLLLRLLRPLIKAGAIDYAQYVSAERSSTIGRFWLDAFDKKTNKCV